MKTQWMPRLRLALVVLVLLALGGCRYGLYVKTGSGWIKGQWADAETRLTRTFLGIPYAQPPVGEQRFAAPLPVQHWSGVLAAEQFGPSCVQRPGALAASGEQSEDCLSLNVYTPARVPRGGAPVMVFIHGGAFIAGGSNQYDGTRLSQEGNAVVVTLNYRLGALGFLRHPALPGSGNAALEDQQLALHWVKENIAAFGGDPDNITLFGESAGAASVCVHMVAPGSAGIAQRYILQSGTCSGGLALLNETQAEAISVSLEQQLCADAQDAAECLRSLDATALVNWGAGSGLFGAGWAPTVIAGSDTLPAPALQLFASGQYNAGATMIGTNRNEWGLFQSVGIASTVSTVAELAALIDQQFGPAAPYLKAEYLPAVDALANVELIRLYSDSVFRCPPRTLARVLSQQGIPVWLYSFDQLPALHAMELPYVFGNPSPVLAPTLVEPLRATVQDYWTAFASAGDPNQPDQPYWPGYDGATDQHMSLQEASAASAQLAQPACDLWDALRMASAQ